MELYRQIKQIAREAATAYEKKIYFGTVSSASPLCVRVDQKFNLTAEFLALSESVTELKCAETVIRAGLKAGDRVLLMNMNNSDYLILDRVV